MFKLEPSTINLLINLSLAILLLTVFRSLLIMTGGKKIFLMAKKDDKSVYFPIINLFVMIDIVDMSTFYGILLFIPILNLIPLTIMSYKLGKVFNVGKGLTIGLIIFPIYCYPLFFKRDYKYKLNEEELFKALDNARAESINLMTEDEIQDVNEKIEEPIENIDSIFKTDSTVKKTNDVYKAKKVDILSDNNTVIDESENFKPIKIVKQETESDKKIENTNTNNDKKVEFIDL